MERSSWSTQIASIAVSRAECLAIVVHDAELLDGPGPKSRTSAASIYSPTLRQSRFSKRHWLDGNARTNSPSDPIGAAIHRPTWTEVKASGLFTR
jgi:hypothetical protein